MTKCPAEEAVDTMSDQTGQMLTLEGSGLRVFLHISEPAICSICNKQHALVFVERVRNADLKGVVSA